MMRYLEGNVYRTVPAADYAGCFFLGIFIRVNSISSRSFTIVPPIWSWYFLIMNIGQFWLLTWYFDNVIPNEFGYARPPWFFLLPSYWGIKLPFREKTHAIVPDVCPIFSHCMTRLDLLASDKFLLAFFI
jgi:hypothetical protein